MKKIIFKSEKKAKAYEIKSCENQGVYSQGEVIMRVITDDISQLLNGQQYKVEAFEIEAQ
jgi:hypothetical protein